MRYGIDLKWFFLIPAAALTVAALRYSYWLPGAWYGDDLRDYFAAVDGQYASGWPSALTTTFALKWRPIFTGLLGLEYAWFRTDLGKYYAVNFLIVTITATLFFFLALRLSRNVLVAACLALILIWSRFATYQVTQVNGPVEGLSFLFFLMGVSILIRLDSADEAPSGAPWAFRLYVLSILLMGLALHVHERYIVTLVVLAPYLMLQGRLPISRRLLLILCICLILIFNIAMKTLVFRIPFFVGTGGTHIGIDWKQIFAQSKQALASLFWFNRGPDYLVGVETLRLPRTYVVLAGAAAASLALLLVVGMWEAVRARANPLLPWLFLAFAAALLVPGLVQIRLEQRWLFASFSLLLLCAAWACGYVRSQKFMATLAVLTMCCALVVENRLIFAAERLFYLTSSARLAEDALALVDGRTAPIVIEGGPPPLCGWVLSEGLFFRMYQGVPRDLYCVGADWAFPRPPPAEGVAHVVHNWGGFRPVQK